MKLFSNIYNFKSIVILSIIGCLTLVGCEEEDDDDPIIETKVITNTVRDTLIIRDTVNLDSVNKYNFSIDFNHLAGNDTVTLNAASMPYTNGNGQNYNVSRLRYLISNIGFHKADGSCFTVNEYHLVDISIPSTMMFSPNTMIPEGDYESITFDFGFNTINNAQSYPDLNSAAWAWPNMLGGGYHFMQLEGMYDSLGSDRFFATHMGTARNNTVAPTTFEDNHFIARPINSAITVNNNFSFNIIMDINQWYENPYTWDFIVYNAPIMPIYDAQRKLNLNGPSVFTVSIP